MSIVFHEYSVLFICVGFAPCVAVVCCRVVTPDRLAEWISLARSMCLPWAFLYTCVCTGPNEYPDPRAPRTSMLRAAANLRVWSAAPEPNGVANQLQPPHPHQVDVFSHLTDDALHKRFLVSSGSQALKSGSQAVSRHMTTCSASAQDEQDAGRADDEDDADAHHEGVGQTQHAHATCS